MRPVAGVGAQARHPGRRAQHGMSGSISPYARVSTLPMRRLPYFCARRSRGPCIGNRSVACYGRALARRSFWTMAATSCGTACPISSPHGPWTAASRGTLARRPPRRARRAVASCPPGRPPARGAAIAGRGCEARFPTSTRFRGARQAGTDRVFREAGRPAAQIRSAALQEPGGPRPRPRPWLQAGFRLARGARAWPPVNADHGSARCDRLPRLYHGSAVREWQVVIRQSAAGLEPVVLARISHEEYVHPGSDWAIVLLRRRLNAQQRRSPMPTECSPSQLAFGTVDGRSVVAGFDGGAMTTDAGALLLGATDRAIGLIDRFATCFSDGRDGTRVEHALATLVGQRVMGIALGGACPRAGKAGPGGGLGRPRSVAARPGAGDPRRQARGSAGGLCAARWQEHAQPARARRRQCGSLSQDRPRPGGGRAAAG